ncbi:hypothetical protein LTR53_017130 [Teratosphaeriaceae sp. CCFEE 6253]|nr:hypothetical protein LTR53_017130 [Teratosphaeriaceae sp. CCFEE 6253]
MATLSLDADKALLASVRALSLPSSTSPVSSGPSSASPISADPEKATEEEGPNVAAPPAKPVHMVDGIDILDLPSATFPAGSARAGQTARVLTEEAAYGQLGFSFSDKKKWMILTSVFIVQLSMNFNAAIYANAVPGMMKFFGIKAVEARLGQMLFLVMYAFGCELWAPWSEELGRWGVLQGSLALVNVWQIPCALAPSFAFVLAFRSLGGISSAGGSVTLGMVADMWEPAEQQYAVAYVVLSSVAGSVLAPIAGGFIQQHLAWQWVFWISLIFGVVAQFIHFWTPETRASVMLAKLAARLRKQGHADIFARQELLGSFRQRIDFREALHLMARPYKLLATEPIVFCLSLLSGFSDALIFVGLESFGLVLSMWHFSSSQVGLAFTGLMIGYGIAYALYMWDYRKQRALMQGDTANMSPERRLRLLLYVVPLEPIGLFGFAWCSLGPGAGVHWIAPLIFTALIGIANFAIYMATIDYMVAAYGPHSASATGGNGFCRDMLAGLAALFAHPFYTSIAPKTQWRLVIPTLILSGIAVVGTLPVYYFYMRGEAARNKSPYARQLAETRAERKEVRREARTRASSPVTSPVTSPTQSPHESRASSRRNSMEIAVAPVRPAAVGKAGAMETLSEKAELEGSGSSMA